MIITIDGPAGSGKSSAARKLAAKLGIAYLDTGAMYRAVALAAIHQGVRLSDEPALIDLARHCDICVDCGPTHTRVTLNGADVSEEIRTMAVNQATSYVARIGEIRRILVDKQREIGRRLGSLVTEGRDQGSVVFPNADIKFFLDASIEKRAMRRFQELIADGEEATYEMIIENLRERDGNDRHQWAPLLEPETALHIDTTQMTIHEVVERLLEEVRQKKGGAGRPEAMAAASR
ncbi:MAG TPA: (d)CMP kinase [Phycisphaerae bacterium]|nr:(d)CMP kinase [Phycisphaerae bacterium]